MKRLLGCLLVTGIVRLKALRLPLFAFLFILPVSGQAGPLPRVNDERDLAQQDRTAPVVVYNRSCNAPCFADYVPDVEEVLAPFVLRMARNESESMQVALYVPSGSNPLQDVRLKVHTDIPSTIGHIYYQPVEELDWVGNMEAERGKPWEGKRDVIPQFVIPVARIPTIEPAQNGVFWITFKTDKTVSPGIHRGNVEVYAAEKLLKSVPFLIRVYPFSLPRPAITYGLYFFPYRLDPAFQGRGFQKLYLADLAAHGMNSMFVTVDYKALSAADYNRTSRTPHGKGWSSTSSRLYCDNYLKPSEYESEDEYNVIKLIDAQIAMGRQAGLIQTDQPLIAQPSNYAITDKATTASALRRLSAVNDWPDIVLYMRDEPGPDVFAKVVEHVGQWKREGVQTICSMSVLAAFGVGHVHDVWIVQAGYITPELQREAERLGAKISTYNFALRTTNAEAGRYYAGLYTWSLGLAGNTSYNYVWLPSYGPGLRKQAFFDEQWKLSKPANLGHVIPSPVGPVPGVGFEGRREGVDDYRTLQLLETRIEAAPKDDPVANAAAQWLERLRQDSLWPGFVPTQSWSADWMDPHPGLSPADYDAIRAKAAAFIVRLAQVEGEENGEPVEVRRSKPFRLEATAFENRRLEDCLTALRSGTIKQKRQAAAALAQRDPAEAQAACPLLVDLLEVPEVRIIALRTLANLGPGAAPAIPRLRELLGADDAFVRTGATYVLTKIGPAATEALDRCKDDPNPTIASLARETLEGWDRSGSEE